MSDEAKEGWGSPGCSKRYHYFRDGISLCRKVGFYRGPLDADDGTVRADDCKECGKKLDQQKKLATKR